MIEYIQVSHDDLIARKTDKLASIIYENFLHLSHYQELKHTKQEINKLLDSKDGYLYLCLKDGQIIGYLLGEIATLPDKRRVCYITYIYTVHQFRKHGIASKLVHIIETRALDNNLDGVLLTCDTEDMKIYDFYLKKGYMPDLKFRKYDKYDVLFKAV